MSLSAGSRLGPYEILSPLGAGGMGEVYRARDARLGRVVAIKVLPPSFSKDADRLRRFEQESKAAGMLNHPNLTAVFDVGESDGSPFLVQELLEGETLREALAAGRFSARRTIDYGIQIARGLAAAHEKGIVHRDLKPENVFVTTDGRVKILDFGLAKLTETGQTGSGTNLPTAAAGTEPGVVLGTLGYMSPEQVKGKPADARSDIFSLGAILYEMLAGTRAFHGDSAAETISAILKEDPPELSSADPNISPGLDRIVRHCLEKSPEARFHSASDVAFALESLSTVSGPAPARVKGASAKGLRRTPLAAAAVLAALAVAFVIGRETLRSASPPAFHRLTFQRGIVNAARFAPDGQTIVYDAAWNGDSPQVFTTRVDSTESRPLGVARAGVLAVSSAGEMALALDRRPTIDIFWNVGVGNLARVALGGGTPHGATEGVLYADFSPDARQLALVRHVGRTTRLEYPEGKVLYETSGYIGSPRVSKDGERVAFLDFPSLGESAGSVAVVDRQGKKTNLASGLIRMAGLAWSPNGHEVWFTGSRVGSAQALLAVSLDGRERLVFRAPGELVLHDVSPDGRALMAMEDLRRELRGKGPGQSAERDLTWLDYPALEDISGDGSKIVFTEFGDAGGASHQAYVRGTDGSLPVRIAEMVALDISRDGRWLLGTRNYLASSAEILLLPAGIGEPRPLPTERLDYQLAFFLPDGARFLFSGAAAGHGVRSYVQDTSGGRARAVTPEGTAAMLPDVNIITADGRGFVARDPQGHAMLWPVDGGDPKPMAGFDDAKDAAIRFLEDGHTLLVGELQEMPTPISRLDLATGKRELWQTIGPPDLTGVVGADNWAFTPDLSAYAYNYARRQSDLYLVSGLR